MLDTDVENDQSEQLSEKLQVFGSKLARLVIEQTSKRTAIESRWLSDLRQYAGKYPAKVEEAETKWRAVEDICQHHPE